MCFVVLCLWSSLVIESLLAFTFRNILSHKTPLSLSFH